MATAYIALGSNIEPCVNIKAALALLAGQCRLMAVSRFYRSRPLNRPEQDDFINGVCIIETAHSPRHLKYNILRPIEEALGRIRSGDAYAARTIDLDILLYDDVVTEEDGLTIPDPDICERPFLFLPLLDLEPRIWIPGTGRALRERVSSDTHNGVVVDAEFTEALKEYTFNHE